MVSLVTGASGFIGSAVVRRLLEAGHEVRVLLRPDSDRRNLEGLPVEVVTGDLTVPSTLPPAVAGCDALFHVAADYRLWAPDPGEIFATNVDGTVSLMKAALAAGVDRIVYTSSVATLGIRDDRRPADEETPVSGENHFGDYKRSKSVAEEKVLAMVEQEGLPAVVVNPSAVIGPRDLKPTPTGRTILDAARGRVPAYVDTGLNFVHVDDVAMGHWRAFERGKVGERYVLGGEDLTLCDVLGRIAALTGQPGPRVRLPHAAVLPVAYAAEAWARFTGEEPLATVNGVRMSKKHMFFSSEKARRELGYEPRPVDEALRDAVAWFRENGYCGRVETG